MTTSSDDLEKNRREYLKATFQWAFGKREVEVGEILLDAGLDVEGLLWQLENHLDKEECAFHINFSEAMRNSTEPEFLHFLFRL